MSITVTIHALTGHTALIDVFDEVTEVCWSIRIEAARSNVPSKEKVEVARQHGDDVVWTTVKGQK
jgi:hypothetical protein